MRGASKGEYMGSSLVDVHVILCDNAPGRLACTLFEGMYVGGLPCQPMRSTGTELHCTTKKPAKHVGGHVFTVRVVITVNGSPYTASCGAPLYAPPPPVFGPHNCQDDCIPLYIAPLPAGAARRTYLCCACRGRHAKKACLTYRCLRYAAAGVCQYEYSNDASPRLETLATAPVGVGATKLGWSVGEVLPLRWIEPWGTTLASKASADFVVDISAGDGTHKPLCAKITVVADAGGSSHLDCEIAARLAARPGSLALDHPFAPYTRWFGTLFAASNHIDNVR